MLNTMFRIMQFVDVEKPPPPRQIEGAKEARYSKQ